MVFKKLLGPLGVGGPTVKHGPGGAARSSPAGALRGHVHPTGEADLDIERIEAGAVVAAGATGSAVGVVGGVVAAAVVDEVGEFFEGGDEEGEEG